MDNYPEDLAPEFEEGGAVSTPFDEWWPKVKHAFPNVPSEVAEQWLHRHWKHSPFSYLPSQKYTFALNEFAISQIANFRSGFVEWSYEKAIAHGEHIWRKCPDIWLCKEFAEKKDFPVPIIVLDNSDGHLDQLSEKPAWHPVPVGIVVVEGHRRHALACYLYSLGRMNRNFRAWVMNSIS